MEILIIADRKVQAASNHRRFAMKLVVLFAWAVFILPFSAAQDNSAKSTASDDSESVIIGDWRGESVCQVRESACHDEDSQYQDRKSTRLNSSHTVISYAVFCLKKKKTPGI